MKTRKGMAFIVLLALFAAILAACGENTPVPASNAATTAASGAATSGNAAQIVKDSRAAVAAIKDYQSSLDMTFTGQGAGNLAMDVILKGSPAGAEGQAPQFKGTVTKSTLPTLPNGTVAVLGKSTFLYDPTTKVVLKGGATSGSSELYNLFLGSQIKALSLFEADLATPTLAGEEKVGDYTASKVTFAPKPELLGTSAFGKDAKGTAWIDKESKLPVKLEYSEEGSSMNWTVTNLQVNKNIGDDKLSFTPPAEAKVVDASQFGKPAKVASLDEAKSKAGFAFTAGYLPAELPKQPTNVGVQTTPLGNIVTAEFSVKSAAQVTPFPNSKGKEQAQSFKGVSIRALKGTANLPGNIPSGAAISDVTIGGQKGSVAVLDKNTILTFAKDGVFYTITSNEYGKDELVKVAEGLK